jgi:hypothetical protein
MPRGLLPLRKNRETHTKAELFPRTEARVVAGYGGRAWDRRIVKRELTEMAAGHGGGRGAAWSVERGA